MRVSRQRFISPSLFSLATQLDTEREGAEKNGRKRKRLCECIKARNWLRQSREMGEQKRGREEEDALKGTLTFLVELHKDISAVYFWG